MHTQLNTSPDSAGALNTHSGVSLLAARELVLPLRSGDFNVTVWGDSKSSPLMLLHGAGESTLSLSKAARLLSANFHVVAFDQRGTGNNLDSLQKEMTFVQYFHDVFDIADALGWKRFGLIGESAGVLQVLGANHLNADRISASVLVDALPTFRGNRLRAVRRLLSMSWESCEAAIAYLTSGGGAPRDEVEQIVQRDYRPITGDGPWRYRANPRLEQILDAELFRQCWEYVPSLSGPVLVARGQKSPCVSDESLAEFRAAATKSTVTDVVIAEAGHQVMMQQPQAFVESFYKFYQYHFPRLFIEPS